MAARLYHFTKGNPYGVRFKPGCAGGPGRSLGGKQGRMSPAERKRRNLTPYAEDPKAQALVDDNPDGMMLSEIADYLGLTRERVRQIEAQALQKLAGPKPGDRAQRRASVTYLERVYDAP